MNFDKNDLASCYNFLTPGGEMTNKVTLLEMNSRGWSRRFVEQALSEGYGEAIELTPQLTEHGVGYYDINTA